MNKVLAVILVITLTSGLAMAGCSPSSTPTLKPAEGKRSTYQLAIDLCGEEDEFFIDSYGRLESRVDVTSADGRISLSLDKGTIVLDKDAEPLQTIQGVIVPSLPPPPEGAYIIGSAYSLMPQGATFDPWLMLTLSYDPKELSQGVKESDLCIACHNGVEWYLPRYRKGDTKAHSVTTQLYHFTTCTILGPKEVALPPTPAEGTNVGNLAPDFQLQSLDGQAFSLSGLRGKPVLVNFWATWCGPCVYEMPYLQQVYEEWTDKGLVLLAINIGESSSQIEKFMLSQGLSLPVLLDTKKEIAQKYNIRGIPTTFFIDRNGIIQDVRIGAFPSKAAIEEGLSKIIP